MPRLGTFALVDLGRWGQGEAIVTQLHADGSITVLLRYRRDGRYGTRRLTVAGWTEVVRCALPLLAQG